MEVILPRIYDKTEVDITNSTAENLTDHTTLPIKIDALPYADPMSQSEHNFAKELIQQELVLQHRGMPKDTLNVDAYFDGLGGALNGIGFDGCPFVKAEFDRMDKDGVYKTIPLIFEDVEMVDVSMDVGDIDAGLKGLMVLVNEVGVKLENLELGKMYGANKWLMYIKGLKNEKERLDKLFGIYKREIENVNVKRNDLQQRLKQKLDEIYLEYYRLVKSILAVETANAGLESDIKDLESRVSNL